MTSKNMLLPMSDPVKGGGGDESLFKGSAMTKRGAYAALSYMACAVLLVMFNKAALSSYNFPCANVITLFQESAQDLSQKYKEGKFILERGRIEDIPDSQFVVNAHLHASDPDDDDD